MKRIGKILVIIIGVIFIIGCSNDEEKQETLGDVLSSKNYIIVDVRTSTEYEESHVKGAINIPYDTIDKNTNLDKNKTILVYCKSGTRSNIAYNILKDLGYNVIDLGAYDNIDLEKE